MVFGSFAACATYLIFVAGSCSWLSFEAVVAVVAFAGAARENAEYIARPGPGARNKTKKDRVKISLKYVFAYFGLVLLRGVRLWRLAGLGVA